MDIAQKGGNQKTLLSEIDDSNIKSLVQGGSIANT